MPPPPTATSLFPSAEQAIEFQLKLGVLVGVQVPPALVETPFARAGDILLILLLVMFVGLRFVLPGRKVVEGTR